MTGLPSATGKVSLQVSATDGTIQTPPPLPAILGGGGGEPCARHIRLYSKCPITFSARFDLLAVIYLPRLDALYAILPTAFRRHLFLTIYHYTLWAICSSNRFHHVFRLLFEKSVLYDKKARSILLHRTKVQQNILQDTLLLLITWQDTLLLITWKGTLLLITLQGTFLLITWQDTLLLIAWQNILLHADYLVLGWTPCC